MNNKIFIGIMMILILGGASAKTGNTLIGDDLTNIRNVSAEIGIFNEIYFNGSNGTKLHEEPFMNVNSSNYWDNLLHPFGLGISGQFLVSQGNGSTAWTSIPPAGSTLAFYFHNTTLSLPYTSKNMDRTINTSNPISYINITSVTNGVHFIGNWTSNEIGVSLIPHGIHQVHFDATKVGGEGDNHNIYLYYECAMVNSTGYNYNIHGTSEYSNEILSTETEVDTDLVMEDMNTNTTDRMVISVYIIQTGTGTLPDLSIQIDDKTDSRLVLPASQIDITPLITNISILQLNVSQIQANESLYVPYNNATQDVNLGNKNLSLNKIYLNGNEVINPSYQYPLVLIGGSPTYTLTVDSNFSYNQTFNEIKIKTLKRNTAGDPGSAGDIHPTFYADPGGFIIEVYNELYDRYTKLIVYDERIDLNSTDVNINGNLNLNGENINTTLQKSRQMAFEVDLNTSETITNDTVLIPYDFYLTNISTLLNNNTGYLNYSISKYSNYPSGKTELATINTSSYLNRTFMNNEVLNRDDVVELSYGNHSIITNAVILFELQRI